MAEAQPTVTYRPVPGHAGYRVGDDGSVWSCFRRVPIKGGGRGMRAVPGGPWKQLKASTDKHGRKMLTFHPSGEQVFVHRLVLLAFVGPCPEGMECCHANDNSSDNRLDNLRWDTSKANKADGLRNGNRPRGERHGRSKLTPDAIAAIRSEYAAGGISQAALGKRHGLSQTQIGRIVNHQRWAHVI